jgi:hypothetical protein
VPLSNNVSTFRGEGGWAGCRCSARGGQRFASAVGQRFNVSRGWGLTAISSHCRRRTTFQRFAATGSDRDDHNNGYSRYWPRPALAQCFAAIEFGGRTATSFGLPVVGQDAAGPMQLPGLAGSRDRSAFAPVLYTSPHRSTAVLAGGGARTRSANLSATGPGFARIRVTASS